MIVNQEMLHELTGNIYLHIGEEILLDSDEWQAFQASADPTELGYTFVREHAE